MRARRGHRSAGACTKPKVKGCSRGRCSRALRQAPLPGRIPARSPGTRARPVRGVPSSWPYGRLELSTRRGVIGARVSPRCASERTNERTAGPRPVAPAATCPRPPPARRPSFYSLFFFRRTRWCCLPPEALAAAGRHPLAAARSQRLGGGWRARSTAAVKGGSSPSTTTGLTWRRERPLRAGHRSLKSAAKGKSKEGGLAAALRASGALPGARRPGPAPPSRCGKGKGAGAREGSGDGRSKEMRAAAGGALASPTCGFPRTVAHRNCHSI